MKEVWNHLFSENGCWKVSESANYINFLRVVLITGCYISYINSINISTYKNPIGNIYIKKSSSVFFVNDVYLHWLVSYWIHMYKFYSILSTPLPLIAHNTYSHISNSVWLNYPINRNIVLFVYKYFIFQY